MEQHTCSCAACFSAMFVAVSASFAAAAASSCCASSAWRPSSSVTREDRWSCKRTHVHVAKGRLYTDDEGAWLRTFNQSWTRRPPPIACCCAAIALVLPESTALLTLPAYIVHNQGMQQQGACACVLKTMCCYVGMLTCVLLCCRAMSARMSAVSSRACSSAASAISARCRQLFSSLRASTACRNKQTVPLLDASRSLLRGAR